MHSFSAGKDPVCGPVEGYACLSFEATYQRNKQQEDNHREAEHLH